jgi:REP element-mobilizing transposase RayT
MSYVASYYHCVFSTKARRPIITPALRERLWPFLGGIARQNQMKAIEIGGVTEHVHILPSLPSTMAPAKALQLIKGGSSKWVHETFPEHRLFAWQTKYGAFGVSVSQLDRIIGYIKSQPAHHKKQTFQEEFWRCSRNLKLNKTSVICGIECRSSRQPSLRDKRLRATA